MKILLIQPSRLNGNGTVYKQKGRWLLGMTLPYVAALTPPGHEVRIKDDLYDEITFAEECDLVALTFMSHQAPRAYQIAQGFRQAGKPVVFGGFHATLAPEETAAHADSLVCGEAEQCWPQLLEDFERGRLRDRYLAAELTDMQKLPIPRYDLVDLRRYRIPNIPVQTTRGCPYACNYCEVTEVYGGRFRYRPINEVVGEIVTIKEQTGRSFVYFVDDIFNADKNRLMEMAEALMPLKIVWSCLCTAMVGNDEEILRLMHRSGCRHINIGMETINAESLQSIHKPQNRIRDYARQFANIRKAGIEFSVNVIFGLDGDDLSTFQATLDFLQQVKAPLSFMFILAPRVGLEIRRRLQAEGRILHDDWTHYTGHECVFRPNRLSKEELEEAFWKAQENFYSLPSIFRRLCWPPQPYTWQSLASNLVFRHGARRRLHPLSFY